jgi:hypothetical protein
MSKESYARGFCKVAAAYCVDAVKLAQYASDAGIGSLVQNDINLSVEHDRNGNVTLGTML